MIAISFVHRIAVEELWIAFGTDKHFRYIPVHKKAAVLGNGICTASPVFRASTGCDTTSSFVSKGKSLPGTHGMLFPISLVLSISSHQPLLSFRARVWKSSNGLWFERTSNTMSVNAARKQLFSKKSRPVDHILATQDSLYLPS